MDLNALAALWGAARGPRHRPARPLSRKRRAITAFMLSLMALYLALASFWAGNAAGAGLAGLDPAAAGKLLWRIPLALGVAGALWDAGCVVDPAPCRPYFVSLPTLILAEGMLGLTTPVKRVLAGLGAVFSLGMAWGRPGLFPLGLGYAALALLWTACLERVIHALAPAGLLRQRAFMILLLAMGASLVLLRGGPAAPAFLPALERAWSLPGAELVRFWQTRQASHLALPLGATLALLAVTAPCLTRDLAGNRRPGTALAGGRTWGFTPPWAGVARLQLHQLLASRSGQLRLFLVVISVALGKEPELLTVGTLKSPNAWSGIAAAFTFGAVLMVPLCNLLGYDRGGVRTWWRAPILDRDLLLGKVAGCAAYGALAAPILLALLAGTTAWHLVQVPAPGGYSLHVIRAARPMGAGELLAVALLMGAVFLWLAGTGLERSLRGAWPLGLDGYGLKLQFDDEKVARVGALLAPLLWMGPVFALTMHFGWRIAAIAMAAVAVGAGLRFRRRLGWAAGDLQQNREEVTLALAAGG
jgi:hypothetical protein